MNPQRPWNLFAILDTEDEPVRRLPLNQELQLTIADIFQEQFRSLFADSPDEVPFDARLTPDESEIAFIPGFELPSFIWGAIANPTSLDPYEVNEDVLGRTKGLFTGEGVNRRVFFQVFDRRRLLSTRTFTILLAENTFRRLTEPGITLANQLAAAFVQDRLYFRSFHTARRLFDLSNYFREATDAELEEFSHHSALTVSDPEMLKENADTWVRKKVALILQSRVLDTQPPAKVAEVAKRYGLSLNFDEAGKLLVPSQKKELKQVLRLLEENFFTSELTGSRYLTNSKRRLA